MLEGKCFDVKIVPVGTTTISAANIQTELNDIYKQTAINWQTSAYENTFAPANWETEDTDGKVDAGNSQFLSNYPK